MLVASILAIILSIKLPLHVLAFFDMQGHIGER